LEKDKDQVRVEDKAQDKVQAEVWEEAAVEADRAVTGLVQGQGETVSVRAAVKGLDIRQECPVIL
jgi:hypothetical protein